MRRVLWLGLVAVAPACTPGPASGPTGDAPRSPAPAAATAAAAARRAEARGPRPAGLTGIDRTIRREPAYKSRSPRYCLLAFGPAADYRVWLVLDADALYVDRDGDGDLTGAGEATGPADADADPCPFRPVPIRRPDGKADEELSFALAGWPDYRAGRATARLSPSVSVTWGGQAYGSWGDETGPCVWGTGPADAPVLHIGGPLQMGFEVPAQSALAWTGSYQVEVRAAVGTTGLGRGSFVHLSHAQGAIPEGVHPTAAVEFPNKAPGPPERGRGVLTRRGDGCRFHGTARVAGARRVAGAGTVRVRLAFDDWTDGRVAPATFELPLPRRAEAGAFRAHLGTFELLLQPPGGPGGRPPGGPGGPAGPGGGVRLVTDPAPGPREGWPAFRISETQAAGVIDYLDRNKLFDDMYDPPPGPAHPGRYVHLRGAPNFDCSWRFPPDADPASVGLFRHLTQALDGEARAAVETFVRAGGAKKE